jgi:menaquinone-dependent protoporphyrinogen oxidase
MPVLVGYASAHGSTRDIAERIAARLRENGLDVRVEDLREAGVADGFSAFVLGSALHNQDWLPEAIAYVHRTSAVLASRPTWLFSVGMPDALAAPLRSIARTEEPKALTTFREALKPRDHRLFSGVVEPDHLPAVGRFVFKAMGGRYGDFRDWDAIDAWARRIAPDLSRVPAAAR